MKAETLKTAEALVRAAIADPAERDEVIVALRERQKATREKPERKDKMLTGNEAARFAGVSRKTIRRWELQGHLHGRHVTRSRVRFSRRELEDFLCESAAAEV